MKKLIIICIIFCTINIGFGQCDFSLGYADPACAGACNGVVWVNTVTGTSPISFSWSTGDTTFSIDDLCPDTYTLTMTDGLGCVYTDSVTLVDPPQDTSFIVDAYIISGTSGPGWCNGYIGLVVQGGTPDYTYYWKDCVTQQDVWSPFPGFCAGEYYCVAVDDNGCIDSTECITVSDPVAGLQQINTQDDFELYPNPVQNQINLPNTEIKVNQLTIFSVDGREVFNQKIENQNSVDVSDLPAGVYVVKIISDEGIFTVKILKE